jgi:hypothetical protein
VAPSERAQKRGGGAVGEELSTLNVSHGPKEVPAGRAASRPVVISRA